MNQRVCNPLLLRQLYHRIYSRRRFTSCLKLKSRLSKLQQDRKQIISVSRYIFVLSRKIMNRVLLEREEPAVIKKLLPKEVTNMDTVEKRDVLEKNDTVFMGTETSGPKKSKQRKGKALAGSPQQSKNSYPENFVNSKSRKFQSRDMHKESTPSKDGLPKMNCCEHWTPDRVSEGLKTGRLIQGTFRINQKNYNNAYITAPSGDRDILIEGPDNRNRAFHGDIVAIEILDSNDVSKKENPGAARSLNDDFSAMNVAADNDELDSQVKGRVVRILEKKHSRMCSGNLRQYKNGSYGVALMSPLDSRLPRVMIPLSECPENFKTRPQDFPNLLFVAEIVSWKRSCALASGKLVKSLGEIGEIEPETEGFLFENNVDFGPFPDNALACLPDESSWHIPAEEYEKRKDLRTDCVFTIDPTTARDLDDALSCKINSDGNFEIGVHIADVSFFIEEGNDLDKVAADRATSVYLIQKVIPMLPRLLCEKLCSLNPAQDKLTYSVIWTITRDGNILNEWFGRSVIRSCCKLTYDHAQQMIDTGSTNHLDNSQFPAIDGKHSIADIHTAVKDLHSLSVLLREKRSKSGALFLNQPKLTFSLNSETGLPNGCGTYISKESNRLVEEFMLLANMAVAHRLIRSHPDKALLRRHPKPNSRMLEELNAICKKNEIGLDIENSKSLHHSLEQLRKLDHSDSGALYYALVALCSKPMQLAKYFCAGAVEDETLYHHYALNVPLYTHFTSPIRRYADIVVHRLLTAALDENVKMTKSIVELQQQAELCNDKKTAAKRVQEVSAELFFNIYMKECGELSEKGVIIGALDSAFDVLLLRSGMVKRIYCNSLPLERWEFVKEPREKLTLFWKNEDNESREKLEEVMKNRQGRRNKDQKEPSQMASKNGKQKSEADKVTGKGPTQTLHIFQQIDVLLKSMKKDGSGYKTNAYICKPET